MIFGNRGKRYELYCPRSPVNRVSLAPDSISQSFLQILPRLPPAPLAAAANEKSPNCKIQFRDSRPSGSQIASADLQGTDGAFQPRRHIMRGLFVESLRLCGGVPLYAFARDHNRESPGGCRMDLWIYRRNKPAAPGARLTATIA
jgi:hypothetical protein